MNQAARWKEYLKDEQDNQDDFDYMKDNLLSRSKFLQDMEKKKTESIGEDINRSRLVFTHEKNKKKFESLEMSKKRKTMILNDQSEENEKNQDNNQGNEDELMKTKNELEETKKKLQEVLTREPQKMCRREGCGAILTSNNAKSLYCSKNQLCLNEKSKQNRIIREAKQSSGQTPSTSS